MQRKGFDRLIEACGRLAQRGKAFSLIIVGQGREETSLHKLANKMGINYFEIIPQPDTGYTERNLQGCRRLCVSNHGGCVGLGSKRGNVGGTPVLCSKYAGCAAELLPESNIFDPLLDNSYDSTLDRIFEKSVCPPDRSKLKTCEEVTKMISRSLLLGSPI